MQKAHIHVCHKKSHIYATTIRHTDIPQEIREDKPKKDSV
jgi:hypothetical protein